MKKNIVRVAIFAFPILLLVTVWHSMRQVSVAEAAMTEVVECVDGMAGIYPCDDVDFLSFMGLDELGTGDGFKAANLWGWTDSETGKEYVLLGMTNTLAIVDISDPVNPVQVGHLPNHTPDNPQKYRDVKVYQDHAFVIADQFSGHGMQVFDLTAVRNITTPTTFTETAHFDGFTDGHNIFINENTGYAYVVRTTDPVDPDPCNGAVYMVNVQDPANPSAAGCFAESYGVASDSMCVVYHGPDAAFQGQEICIVASDDDIIVGDVTSKTNPIVLANVTYPNIERAHLAWLTDDHRYFVSADMNDEMMHGLNTRIFIWDFTQVMTPTLMGIYEGDSPASDHNVWVDGDYAYVGNFRAGMQILDLRNIGKTTMSDVTVEQAAFFDMYPADDNTGHVGGAWAVYPYFESGVVAVSDREAGLYLLRPDLEKAVGCVDGMAGIYPCDDVDLLSYMGLDELGTEDGFKAANLWGWMDSETGKEYVLLGMTNTLAILDISDPVNPVQVGHLPNHTPDNPQKYRDVKVYQDHAFVIADQFSGHGMQVFDLTAVRNITTPTTFTATAHFDGFTDAHNVFINEDTGYAYVVRTTDPVNPDPCGGAVYMVNIQDPLNPSFAGCFAESTGYASDSMCVVYHGPDEDFQGHEICLIASDDNIVVGDVTSKTNPIVLADVNYLNAERAHLAWLTEDHRYFVSADMNDEMVHGSNTRIFIWDFTQVMIPTLMGIYEGDSPASDHNVWVDGDYAYVGNFRAGMQILDLRNISQTTMSNVTVEQAAFFDMYPADDNTGHIGGAWAIYPYFESGVVAVSDREAGLYLLRPDLTDYAFVPFLTRSME